MAFFTALFSVLGEYAATLIFGSVLVGGAAIALTPKGRLLAKSAWNWVTASASNNPRIAEGAYDEKIKQLNEKLDKANQANEIAQGELAKVNERIARAQREFERLSRDAVSLKKKGNHAEAIRLALEAKKQQDIVNDNTANLPDYQAMADHAEQVVAEVQGLIEQVKTNKTKTLNNMEKAKLEKDVTRMLNDVSVSTLDTTIAGIEAHAEKEKYQAIGARVSYENSDKKQLERAKSAANAVDAEEFLQQLLLSSGEESDT